MTVARINDCFKKLKAENKTAFITYMMAYDPDYKTSLKIMKGLPDAGSDIIELGMPFSDPMADGITIQEAANRALKTNVNVKNILSMVKEFRKGNNKTPIILMGYYNPIYRYGVEKFVKDAVSSGVDGVIIVDLPPEEEGEFTKFSKKAKLSLIKLTAPTTDAKRAKVVLKNSSGFVYYISVAGITGTKTAVLSDIKKSVARLKKSTKLPVVVGFGIKTADQAGKVGEMADGVVVGSALVSKIKENLNNKANIAPAVLKLAKQISLGIKK